MLDLPTVLETIHFRQRLTNGLDSLTFQQARDASVYGHVSLRSIISSSITLPLADADVAIRGSILLIHGYAEHSGRYNHVAKYLCDNNFKVYGYDHKFHGDNESNVGWGIKNIKTFDDLIDDCAEVVNKIEENAGGLPYFVLGHSMGGLITILTTLRLQSTWKCNGVVLSGPLVRAYGNILAPYPYATFYRGLAHCISNVMPLLPSPGVDTSMLTHVPEVIAAAKADPTMFGEKVSTRYAQVMVTDASYFLQKRLEDFEAPFLLVVGTEDKVTNPQGGIALHERASSKDKKMIKYDGLYHEILNEVERDQVLSDVVNWLNDHK